MNYYNENDPKAAAWLRELISEKLIPTGHVDERSITEIRPHELIGYTQQHFFAGIGGWSFALRLAGWPDSHPVRTGSCPCQPFSAAGKGLGEKDERHLWPVFRDLITFGEPTVTFGEQVASAAGLLWMSGVRADLEGQGYEFGAGDLPAACFTDHTRQRIFWVANPKHNRMAIRRRAADPRRKNHGSAGVREPFTSGLPIQEGEVVGIRDFARSHREREPEAYWLPDGIPARVVRVRGYGNAIQPYVAAEFITAFIETQAA